MYSDEFINIISILNKNHIDYVFLNDNKIENNYDLLIKNNDYSQLLEKCRLNKLNDINNENYWYGASKPKIWIMENNERITIYKQLLVRSLTSGIWIPLDKIIQKSAFENRTKFEISSGEYAFILCNIDKIVYSISNSVFTTKVFSENDISFITRKLSQIDVEQLEYRLDKVFFKYTEKLMEQINNGSFNQILHDYIRFKEY